MAPRSHAYTIHISSHMYSFVTHKGGSGVRGGVHTLLTPLPRGIRLICLFKVWQFPVLSKNTHTERHTGVTVSILRRKYVLNVRKNTVIYDTKPHESFILGMLSENKRLLFESANIWLLYSASLVNKSMLSQFSYVVNRFDILITLWEQLCGVLLRLCLGRKWWSVTKKQLNLFKNSYFYHLS